MAEHPVPDHSAFFPTVCHQLRRTMRKEQYDTWFRGFELKRLEPENRLIEFGVHTAFVRDWIQRNFLHLVVDAVSAAGLEQPKILFTVGQMVPQNRTADRRRAERDARIQNGGDHPPEEQASKEPESKDLATASVGSGSVGAGSEHRNGRVSNHSPAPAESPTSPAPTGTRASTQRPRILSLNRNYTFEHFVVGPSNRLAHAAALTIGENPGCSFNPLYIHGNVGLGKTHLLQAFCHSIRRRNPNARVVYLTSEEFTNEFIAAIRQNSLESFRAYHREADVLVVDDIQFLASKDKTQEEFFHTFNSLYQHQKQIVLSSDRSPRDIPTLEERLVTRFKWGMVAEVEVPDFETRVAIVQRKARLRGQENGIPDDVAYMIAERIANNIRELEGAVIKVIGTGSILGREVNLELAEEALRGVAKARNHNITMDKIMEVVTAQFPVSVRDIIGKGRTQAISYPRQIAMFLGRKHTDHSLEEIGKYFGNRDHTTVLYSVNKIAERIEKDRMLKELLDTLSGRLQR